MAGWNSPYISPELKEAFNGASEMFFNKGAI
jgi:hypothetical protein